MYEKIQESKFIEINPLICCGFCLFVCFVYCFTGSLFLHGIFSSCGEWVLLFLTVSWFLNFSGFSCCETQALGTQASLVVVWGLSHWDLCNWGSKVQDQCLGPAALRHVESSWTGKSNLCLLYWQADFNQLYHRGSLILFF